MHDQQASALPPGLVIYQIYPRSFQDTNGDGVGDLLGIIKRLAYLADLGITAIWLCPIYPSPMVDFGYDVSDYCGVDPLFGTLEQLDQLVQAAHQRGIKLILDLVLNHTSDQHAWFQKSRQSLDNSKRDWYIWKSPRQDGSPPNNWLSTFGGPAWELDPQTNQYYLHSFFKQQPDLNWENPAVRAALKDVMRFWLDRGIDGFRLDAVYWYGKDPSFHDDPINPHYDARSENPYDALLHSHSKRQKSVFVHLNELAEFLAKYHDRFMVTEAYPHEPFNVESYLEFYEYVNPRVAAPFNFMSMYLQWNAANFQRYIDKFQAALKPDYKPVYVYGNHDSQRLASRLGPDATRGTALLQLMLPGIAVIYYGEELGMENAVIPANKVLDQWEKNVPGLHLDRDVSRTPLPWSNAPHAGFSSTQPWLPVVSDYRTRNVTSELADPDSLLNLYKKLLAFRKHSLAIQRGSYRPLQLPGKHVLGFVREYQGHRLAIVINFSSAAEVPLALPGETLLSTHAGSIDPTSLRPSEGRIIAL